MIWETRQRAVMAACARERGDTSFASRAFVAPHWRQPPATRFGRAGGGKGLGGGSLIWVDPFFAAGGSILFRRILGSILPARGSNISKVAAALKTFRQGTDHQ